MRRKQIFIQDLNLFTYIKKILKIKKNEGKEREVKNGKQKKGEQKETYKLIQHSWNLPGTLQDKSPTLTFFCLLAS